MAVVRDDGTITNALHFMDFFDFSDFALANDEIADFIADKMKKFYGSEWDDTNRSMCDCLSDYVDDNREKWKRELRGNNLYRVKVVVEVNVESPWKLDEVVKEVQHRLDIGLDGIFEDETHTIINAIGKEVDE